MARSMTGFGKASIELDGELVSIEVSSVNHRFLDCTVRLPNCWSLLEPMLRETVKGRVERGKLNVYVSRKRGTETRQTVCFDPDVARQYVEASRQLANLMNTTEAISLNVVAQLEGVFYEEDRDDDIERVNAAIVKLLIGALEQLNTMREAEGASLVAELCGRIECMQAALGQIETQLPEATRRYEERLRARLRELNTETGLTEERLAIELAIMADKADVTEEIVRLKCHLSQALEHLHGAGAIGRELNFLAQEIQREANTLGSKLRDGDVGREVLRIKVELEKWREQVQNIE